MGETGRIGSGGQGLLPRVRFGKQGPEVTKLGFGGIPIQQLSDDEAVRVVRACYDGGIRFFDTARAYTNSEERIGRALRGKFGDVFLSTKSAARDLDTLKRHFQTSLEQLGADHFDLFLFHNVSDREHLHDVLGARGLIGWLREQQAAGRVGMIGFSSHRVETALEALRTGEFAAVEFPLNYLEDQALPELLPLARETGAGFIAMKPLAGGALSSGRAAVRWLMSQPDVVVIPGMMAVREVEEALLAAADQRLTPEDLAAIERDRNELTGRFCRRCGYCLPCPQGIPVNTVISADLFFRRAGWNRADEKYLQMLEDAAANCQECGECESRCPYNLPLAGMVRPTALRIAERVRAEIARRARPGP